ncbi:MAG: hypothetical protein AAFV19_23755 [Pseudomonadota bacterium]
MRRFYGKRIAGALLILGVIFSACGVAANERKNLWVGSHLIGVVSWDAHVLAQLDFRINDFVFNKDLSPELEKHVIRIKAVHEPKITAAPSLLRSHYNNARHEALMVMSGVSTGGPEGLVSFVFAGDSTDKFSINQIRANLLSIDSQPAARDYVDLFLIYTIMKEAVRQNLDFETYVKPLRQHALDLVLTAMPADPKRVAQIRDDLEALTP